MIEIIIAVILALTVFGFFTMKITWFRVLFFVGLGIFIQAMVENGGLE